MGNVFVHQSMYSKMLQNKALSAKISYNQENKINILLSIEIMLIFTEFSNLLLFYTVIGLGETSDILAPPYFAVLFIVNNGQYSLRNSEFCLTKVSNGCTMASTA